MNIFPAIDIVNGCAVRLFKGDYDQMTIYSDDPASVAVKFEEAGCKFIHLVDLEGAKNGTTPNIETVKKIRSGCSLFMEIGGGIRSMETIRAYLDLGISRVILGSAALKNPQLVADAIAEFGSEKIVVGIDAKNEMVATEGWLETSDVHYIDLAHKMVAMGVRYLIFTDISKDGTLSGVNAQQLAALAKATAGQCNIIASGGVHTMEDIFICRDMGLYGTICGKSIYQGTLDLAEAIAASRTLTIRPMQITDYAALYELWVACGNGLNNLDDSEEGVAKYLRRNPNTSFVAEENGKVVGAVLAGHDGRRGFIQHMAVDAARRRRGIGSKLVTVCLDAMKQEGIHKVALVAFKRNQTGNAFWEQQGFTVREDLNYRNLALCDMIRFDPE